MIIIAIFFVDDKMPNLNFKVALLNKQNIFALE